MGVRHIQTSGVLGPLVLTCFSFVRGRRRQEFIKIRTDSFALSDDDSDEEVI